MWLPCQCSVKRNAWLLRFSQLCGLSIPMKIKDDSWFTLKAFCTSDLIPGSVGDDWTPFSPYKSRLSVPHPGWPLLSQPRWYCAQNIQNNVRPIVWYIGYICLALAPPWVAIIQSYTSGYRRTTLWCDYCPGATGLVHFVTLASSFKFRLGTYRLDKNV